MNGKTNVTVSGGNDSLGGIIPLNPPTDFVVTADNAKCLLTWTDPLDKYADDLGQITDEGDQLVSQFAFTRIVRKEGGYPGTPDDGVTVTESSVRNQYQSSVYIDEGLTNNITYHYAAFTCNTDGVWSGSATGSGTPEFYFADLAKNNWEQIEYVANQGIAPSVWEVGDTIDIVFENIPMYPGEIEPPFAIQFAICGFNNMDLADGSGKAAITFIANDITDDWEIPYDDFRYSSFDGSAINKYLTNEAHTYFPSDISTRMVDTSTPYYSSFRALEKHSKVFTLSPREVLGDQWASTNNIYNDFEDDDPIGGAQFPYFATTANRLVRDYVGNNRLDTWSPSDIFWILRVIALSNMTNMMGGIDCRWPSKMSTGGGTRSFIRPAFSIGKTPA